MPQMGADGNGRMTVAKASAPVEQVTISIDAKAPALVAEYALSRPVDRNIRVIGIIRVIRGPRVPTIRRMRRAV
jgi:hypothetical protein